MEKTRAHLILMVIFVWQNDGQVLRWFSWGAYPHLGHGASKINQQYDEIQKIHFPH